MYVRHKHQGTHTYIPLRSSDVFQLLKKLGKHLTTHYVLSWNLMTRISGTGGCHCHLDMLLSVD